MVKKFLCKTCKKTVGYSKLPIQCDECNSWFHGICENLSADNWKYLGDTVTNWLCNDCYKKAFPFYDISDEDLESLFTDLSEEETVIFKRCMEFENINLDYLPFNYVDEENITCMSSAQNTHYVTHTELNAKNNVINNNVSIIHFNARSLQKNFDNLQNMLQYNDLKFSVIGVSETWLTNDCNTDYYTFDGYNGYFTNRLTKKGGGTALYISSDISNVVYKEGTYCVENCFEVTTVKIKLKDNVVAFVSCIYKSPNTNVDDFMFYYTEFLNKFKGKTLYICGDFNIDLMKYNEHTSTSRFLDLL